MLQGHVIRHNLEDAVKMVGGRRWWRRENGGEEENCKVEDNREDENGGEEMVRDSEVTPNLMASTLKQPSCSTSLHVVKYLAIKMICIFFHCCLKKMNIVLICLTFSSLLQDAMECSVAWAVTLSVVLCSE